MMFSSSYSSSRGSSSSSCSIRLSTLVNKITEIPNPQNASIISAFHEYMQEKGSSENHQVINLKVILDFAKFLGTSSFYDVKERKQIMCFLNKKIKPNEQDLDKKWITTWNHYLNRTKLFVRWLYNHYSKQEQNLEVSEEWTTPEFCKIKSKKTKRLIPYLESEIWERDEFLAFNKV